MVPLPPSFFFGLAHIIQGKGTATSAENLLMLEYVVTLPEPSASLARKPQLLGMFSPTSTTTTVATLRADQKWTGFQAGKPKSVHRGYLLPNCWNVCWFKFMHKSARISFLSSWGPAHTTMLLLVFCQLTFLSEAYLVWRLKRKQETRVSQKEIPHIFFPPQTIKQDRDDFRIKYTISLGCHLQTRWKLKWNWEHEDRRQFITLFWSEI